MKRWPSELRARAASHRERARRRRGAAQLRGPDHARRVELDALHVDQLRAGPEGHGVTVAGALPRVRRELPGLADAAGRDDDRLGLEGDELTGGAPVRDAPRDATLVVVDELQDLALHEDVGVHRDDFLLEGTDQLQPGAVPDVGESRVAVTAEVALEDLAVLGAVEER